jgi:hypothetical protein
VVIRWLKFWKVALLRALYSGGKNMHDAAVERLARLISEPQSGDDGSGSRRFRPRRLEVHIGLAEGWFSLFLLATVVYSTIWCIQAVGWVAHLNILSLTTAVGLICGLIAAKQQRFSRVPVHVVAIGFGLLLAFWQTAGAFYQGNAVAFEHAIRNWISILLTGDTGDNDAIFLFFITALGFILAYTSSWLVYRTRSPWLMIVANAVVLLINLSNVDAGFIVFLVVFLIASLLLLLRFNLYESVRRWQRQGLRYADDIGWDVMQAGALISIGILVLSWILPAGYTNAWAAQLWTLNANPWVQLENTWNRVISVNGGINPSNHGNFRDTLTLGGNPNLNHDIVFTVQSDDGSQYLASLSFETYTGVGGWVIGPTTTLPVKANSSYPDGALLTHTVQQKITVVNPPGEQYPYIFGASDILSTNLPGMVLGSQTTGSILGWLKQGGNLAGGTTYTVVSTVSSADVGTLRSVPLPKDAPKNLSPDPDAPIPPTYYDPSILRTYLQLPNNLDPQIAALAKHIVNTAHATTMYDEVVALESYLRDNYAYSVDVQPPPGEEGVSWFLFRSGHKGFCNYFASAMAVMARSLGIPARVVQGYTNGDYDTKQHDRVVRGTDAHAWTQVYFAGYGWINFEPSASFSPFARPLPNQFPSGGSITGGGNGSGANAGLLGRKNLSRPEDVSTGLTGTATTNSPVQLRQQVGLAFGSLVLLILFACILFGLWWMRLFRRYDLAVQFYGRICLLASWAGIELRPSQTPYEYMQELTAITPKDAAVLERLGDIYVRDRWADPDSTDHPRRSGEINELPAMWKRLQPILFLYVLRHPYFLRLLPKRAENLFAALRKRRRVQQVPEIVEEDF